MIKSQSFYCTKDRSLISLDKWPTKTRHDSSKGKFYTHHPLPPASPPPPHQRKYGQQTLPLSGITVETKVEGWWKQEQNARTGQFPLAFAELTERTWKENRLCWKWVQNATRGCREWAQTFNDKLTQFCPEKWSTGTGDRAGVSIGLHQCNNLLLAIFKFQNLSLSKRGWIWNLSCENELYLHENKISFSYQ